jgi:hypothetical protein
MARMRFSHAQREDSVLSDLEAHFPKFTGQALSWTKVPDGQDPPDFLSTSPGGPIGLELIEWLAGDQMGPAKGRESQRDHIRTVICENWQAGYQPQNFKLAVLIPNWGQRIERVDEALLRQAFFACAEHVDATWNTNPDRMGRGYHQDDFSNYPTIGRYFQGIRYIGGGLLGVCWIDVEQDGGAYDPVIPAETLEQALGKKLVLLSTPSSETRLRAHGLAELYLLVHGGSNMYMYNTPSGPMTLEEIARRGAAFYSSHPLRHTFNRVWFFDSLDSADEVNVLLGLPPGSGRVRWLAQIWPRFSMGAA